VLGLTTLRERSRVSRTVIDASTYVGRSAVVEGAVVGRNCDIKAHARVHEGVAIGDQVHLGDQSVIFPGVRIYPYKEVEYGADPREPDLGVAPRRASSAGRRARARQRRPHTGARRALRRRDGTALRRGARVVASRESAPAYRMIKRADLRAQLDGRAGRGPADVARAARQAPLKTQSYDLAFHVGA
jgi:carbonic anhydrase/acetyltransferase-like protein (isoleucine patch superfamily)